MALRNANGYRGNHTCYLELLYLLGNTMYPILTAPI